MTPLEEVEQAIAEARTGKSPAQGVNQLVLLSNLYQARAIERLQSTVETFGIAFAKFAAEAVTFMGERAAPAPRADPATWGIASWDAPHPFKPGLRDECQCMRPRTDPIHSVPIPRHRFYAGRGPLDVCDYCTRPMLDPIHLPDVCVLCGVEVGQRHRPSCQRQGIVSKESTRV